MGSNPIGSFRFHVSTVICGLFTEKGVNAAYATPKIPYNAKNGNAAASDPSGSRRAPRCTT